jgi:glycine oxidase
LPTPSRSPDVIDVIIIGAGIIGASIAWKLARAGLRVTLLDAGSMGGEASWAGAGMLAPGGEVETRDVWSDLALESLRMYPEFIAQLESESGLSIDYQRCGGVEVAFDDAEWQTLLRRAQLQLPLGIHSHALDGPALRERVPLFDRHAAGALLYPEDAIVDPRDIMRALRAACGATSIEVREGWRVTGISISADSVTVQNQRGDSLHAANAVLAAGAWSSEIRISGGALPPPPLAFPVKGHLTGYQLAAGSLGPILRRGHTYLLQRSSGFTIAGTSSEHVGFDRALDQRVVGDITERVCELLPFLRGRELSTAWAGFRPAAESLGPVIRRAGDSALWLAYGHYRNGILLAPVTARLVSDEILGVARRAAQASPVHQS